MRIALVKQEVYQDLYVCPASERDAAEILYSSQMRVGPIGLMAELDADFYIVHEEPERETGLYRRVIRSLANHLPKLKTQTIQCLPGLEFAEPGSPHPNGKFAVSCRSIDWGKYDAVISINISLPTQLVLSYPSTLFAYMIGEANSPKARVRFGYDVLLNQMARGFTSISAGQIDFPYTFLKGNTLEKLLRHTLCRDSLKRGIFMEINSTDERPVTQIPEQFNGLINKGYVINLHQQRIRDNLTTVYDSKYFLKLGGRKIRGNSVAEAISLGVLAIMNRNETIHHELIPDCCHVETVQQAEELIDRFESDPIAYKSALDLQRTLVDQFFFEAPLESLKNCMIEKRKDGRAHYSFCSRIADFIWLTTHR